MNDEACSQLSQFTEIKPFQMTCECHSGSNWAASFDVMKQEIKELEGKSKLEELFS